MAETQQQQFSETQLVQMAQAEEASMNQKRDMLEQIISVLRESSAASEALKELQKTKGTILVDLGMGVMIEAQVKDATRCKRNFAENGFLEEDSEKTIEWIKARRDNLETQANKLRQEVAKSQQRLTDIIGILKQMESQKNKLFNVK
ncbi:MAG: hypothetical protein AABW59_00240 [archaeon]